MSNGNDSNRPGGTREFKLRLVEVYGSDLDNATSPLPDNEDNEAPDKKESLFKKAFWEISAAIGNFTIAKSKSSIKSIQKTFLDLKGEEILDSDDKKPLSRKEDHKTSSLLKQAAVVTALVVVGYGGCKAIFNDNVEEPFIYPEISDADKAQQQQTREQLTSESSDCIRAHQLFQEFNHSGEGQHLKLNRHTLADIGNCSYIFSIGLEQPQPCLELEKYFHAKSTSITHPDWEIELKVEPSDQEIIYMRSCVGATLPEYLQPE